MYVMDGIECLEEIGKIDKITPIVALSAFAGKNNKSKYFNIGFIEYITKPVELQDLFNTLERVLKQVKNKME